MLSNLLCAQICDCNHGGFLKLGPRPVEMSNIVHCHLLKPLFNFSVSLHVLQTRINHQMVPLIAADCIDLVVLAEGDHQV